MPTAPSNINNPAIRKTDAEIFSLISKKGIEMVEKQIPFNLKFIFRLYFNSKKTIPEICSSLDVNPDMVRNGLIKIGDCLLKNNTGNTSPKIHVCEEPYKIKNNTAVEPVPEKQTNEEVTKEIEWNAHIANTAPMQPDEVAYEMVGLPNDYYITNYGRVWKKEKDHYKVMYVNTSGTVTRAYTQIWIGKKRKIVVLRRVVAECFVPNPENFPCVLHKNGNRQDCRASNLYWGFQLPTAPKWNIESKQKGSTTSTSKLNEKQVIEIFNSENKSHRELAETYKVSRPIITGIMNGKRWGWLTKHPDWLDKMSYKLIKTA